MTLELRVLSGSRAGATLRFEKGVVGVGRHATSDLRFDPQADLDVSTRHAEFREGGGAWLVADEGSTNGTLVNGKRITGEQRLADGDIVSFGANGPRVEVRTGAAPGAATRMDASVPAAPRLNTEVRVAAAVKKQTKSMKTTFAVVIGLIVVLGVAGFTWMQRKSSAREAELNALIARGDSATSAIVKTMAAMRPSDSAVTRQMAEELARTRRDLESAKKMITSGNASRSDIADMSRRMGPVMSVGQMDVNKVYTANDAAVAFVVSDLDGQPTGGTGFCVSASGLLVTNKHVVRSEAGAPARRLVVMFANTNKYLPAHIVRVSDGDDLALIQVDVAGPRPTVLGVSRSAPAAKVGAPVVTIGFPLSNDTPMEGTGLNITARTTTTPGTVSKRLDDVLQIDSFSAHGASGSPLFDADGNVVGVIYGGVKDSGGRIVLAVPAQRLSAFLAADGAGIVR